MAEESYKVTLNVYDLSQGLARQLSTTFLGKAIEGIWHTGIVVYGNEYYFGGGIQHCSAGTTPYGNPVNVVELGVTHVPKDVFEMYLQEISPRYTAETYSLLTHNCNNFSNEVTQFLVGATIPEYILNLPSEVMNSPMGALIMPMIQQLETTLRSGAVPQTPQFQPSAVAMRTTTTTTSSASTVKSSDAKDKNVVANEEKPVKSATKEDEDNSEKEKNKVGDPLGNARNKVQEEIMEEFAAIMASGTLRASEAAALATRRVMSRYSNSNVVQS
ncbi:desumoylating isopeptidase 1-like [Impatiens glandulifera]|uniref:desumoylating isopeptidase 1-like n=1 Tax=Impatiens glandulifera TaxID=253017 RepID=UPI001FB1365B|nr:desumoylating isopeptidase 1-like [Impatiens glandulifera]